MRVALCAFFATGVMVLAAGCGGTNAVSLRSAEAAFAQHHVAFASDWQSAPKNPYLSASASGLPMLVPSGLRAHVQAMAAWESPVTYKGRLLFVFDSAAEAARFASWANRQPSHSGVVLVSRNLAYLGEDVPGVRAAMSSLRS